jgi:uncharacterized protein (DUF1015 family)
MAVVEPLQAMHYVPAVTGGLQPVIAPPYDVIDAAERATLAARSPYNVVAIDLPEEPPGGGDRYAHAGELMHAWLAAGVLSADREPAIWPLEQRYTGPDGQARTRRGFLARVRIEEYGAGRIRPHERTHPGPRLDRLRLTRATRTNLSPIFSLFSDPAGAAWSALQSGISAAPPWAEAADENGNLNRLWRVTDANAIDAVRRATDAVELLIADGHHRYETARVYADEIGGEGPHRYVLMCLVALQDPGLMVFPTHRLVRGLTTEQQEALAGVLRRDFEVLELQNPEQLRPPTPRPDEADTIRIGYIDARLRRPLMLTLKDPAVTDRALSAHAGPYRRLDTAVLEALILKGALGMSDERIDELDGLGYARSDQQALSSISDGEYDAAFFMGAVPMEHIQAVAATGETMPPKSTYFYPKVPTGLVFNPLR